MDNRRLHADVPRNDGHRLSPRAVRYKLYKVYPRSESLLGKRVFEQYKKVSEARRESRLAEEVEKFSSVLFTAPRRSAVARPFLLVSQISGSAKSRKLSGLLRGALPCPRRSWSYPSASRAATGPSGCVPLRERVGRVHRVHCARVGETKKKLGLKSPKKVRKIGKTR